MVSILTDAKGPDPSWPPRLLCLALVGLQGWGACCRVMGQEALTGIELPASCRQVIVVRPSAQRPPFAAQVSALARMGDNWNQEIAEMPAVMGRKGLAAPGKKVEGDGHTPQGRFRIGVAFGRAERVVTRLSYRKLTAEDFWIDDPASPKYNQWVIGQPEAKSYETMLRTDGLYDLGVVIEYNTEPVVSGAGSAIFLHIWEGPAVATAGCVALERRNVERLLAWLDRDREPWIWLRAD